MEGSRPPLSGELSEGPEAPGCPAIQGHASSSNWSFDEGSMGRLAETFKELEPPF